MRLRKPELRHHAPPIILVLLLASCASSREDRAQNDSVAPTNRTIFAGNLYVDHHVLRPVARAYVADVPNGARRSIHDFVSNLDEPEILINDLLQGNMSRSWNTLQRFTINTTVGGLGLFDVAQGWGLPRHDADFGQTLGVWNVPAGLDIQMPLLGFTNVRDLVGKGVGMAANPFSLVGGPLVAIIGGAHGSRGVIDGWADALPLTDAVEKNALDEYATLRSVIAQHRAAFVQDGRVGKVHPTPPRDLQVAETKIADCGL